MGETEYRLIIANRIEYILISNIANNKDNIKDTYKV